MAKAQRMFVGRIFEEGKNITGMADYLVRSWTGFHGHVALSSLGFAASLHIALVHRAFHGLAIHIVSVLLL